MPLYFGNGCFWGRQKDYVDAERKVLGRAPEQVTAVVGYAGGKKQGAPCDCAPFRNSGASDGATCCHVLAERSGRLSYERRAGTCRAVLMRCLRARPRREGVLLLRAARQRL